jgi:Leucine-rich repeat (LRR) protein
MKKFPPIQFISPGVFLLTAFLLVPCLLCNSCSSGSGLVLDRNLERGILEKLGKPGGVLTLEDLQSLTKLELPDRNIRSVEGIQLCTNLDVLNLMHNEFSDISRIGEMRNLTELYLDSPHISDISPLANLTNLEFLSLQSCTIDDISPIENLPWLRWLNLTNTPFAGSALDRRF